mmetsp:Transcript_6848/g.15031  ORF Transcript_6848/g.15031 Transcript_6848/m.15031 type:complete len:265 (+) Transcript_6848:526-1320(+)
MATPRSGPVKVHPSPRAALRRPRVRRRNYQRPRRSPLPLPHRTLLPSRRRYADSHAQEFLIPSALLRWIFLSQRLCIPGGYRPLPEWLLLSHSIGRHCVPPGTLLPRRGEHRARGVLSRHIQSLRRTGQLHRMPHGLHLSFLGYFAARALSFRLRVYVSRPELPGSTVPRWLSLWRRYSDYGSISHLSEEAADLQGRRVLPGWCGELFDCGVDCHTALWRHAAPVMCRRYVLPGRRVPQLGQWTVLPGPLLPPLYLLPYRDAIG